MTTKSITSDPRTKRQEKQYRRFFDDARDNSLIDDPNKDGLQRLIGRGGEFQAYIVAGIKRFSAKLPDYCLARTILGKDFISPEDVSKSRGIAYTEDQLSKFGDTLPSQEMLEWCRDNGYMIVAGPNVPMSLLDIRNIKPEYFYQKTGGWYDGQKFASDDKAGTVWLAIRKNLVPNSTSKNWSEQQALLSSVETVPSSAEVAWAITTYKAVRGVYLLGNIYVRTSSLRSDGDRVHVGYFDDEGLIVDDYWDDSRVDSIGVSSARK